MTAGRPAKTENVAAVMKVFAVLETLAERGHAGLADIAQVAMTSKSTAHRLLQTMVDLGYVEQEPETERYGLTLKLFGLGARTLKGQEALLSVADRGMGRLSRAFGESVNLGVMDSRDQRVAYIHTYESAFSLSMQTPLGMRNPLYCTSLGKALLAWRDPVEIEDRLSQMDFAPRAPNTITDPATLRARLPQIRAQGYAEEIEEAEAGVRCLAAPILDHRGRSVAAVSLSFPLFRFDESKKPDYVALLLEITREASETLGWDPASAEGVT
ncbi:IclR family transcriptional regulator domain-containing protein [Mangrovicoccus algicola]|uniref:Helix-turn-helix domain-containing protein n=1 Tax=Mangrovicoccus algicola TaxID=2771008 RepID=A0A8J6YY76_9RHOB|nr:IclR family transcriptional regulator C-terminal domain-containing protein [Mangrovicoccus algicola]MBE3637943.1 helix-turn-helix domain-containing protein [Mangrovicoccus algicola]